MKQQRLIIIGLDGVPYPMLKNFAENGIMPNTASIISRGFFTPMQSAIPEISCVAWSSIITGTNPAEHGIFGFMDLHTGTYDLKFPNFNDLKAEPFWNKAVGKSIIINVPATYPVKEMNGVHISGFVSIDFNKSVYPPALVGELQKLDYRLDVDSQIAHKDMALFLQDLDLTLEARIRAINYLWDYCDWQVFMPTFTGTDRLMHFLWSAYEDKNHKNHHEFVEHFRKIDAAIGNIYSKLNDNDTLIMLSDHGFEGLDKDIYINHFLQENGFLKLAPSARLDWSCIDYPTKAFALDPARIYINFKDKYPRGSVQIAEKEHFINQLCDLFYSLDIEGRKVVKTIHLKEEIYSGPYKYNAPDLVLVANEGFNLKAALSSQQLASTSIFTGKHTLDNAFLLINNSDLAKLLPEKISVTDAGRFIKKLTT